MESRCVVAIVRPELLGQLEKELQAIRTHGVTINTNCAPG